MRELHWHPNASEWQFYIAGKARMTVFMPVGNARTMDYNANDVGFVPAVSGHYIENTGDTDLVFLEMFAADEFQDVSLNNWLRRPSRSNGHCTFESRRDGDREDSCRKVGSDLENSHYLKGCCMP